MRLLIQQGLAIVLAVVPAVTLGSCGSGDDASNAGTRDASVCMPQTCAELGAQCGKAINGCNAATQCGECSNGEICGGGGENKCGAKTCKPLTCTQVEASCGLVSDGCADVLDCGSCPAPLSCGGAGTPNQCSCSPRTCTQLGASCGTAPDGCGGVADCGTCPDGQTCGAAGPNQCGIGNCAIKTCSQAGASCGIVSDGCGDVLDCGSCAAPNVCGGAGVANQCGCANKTCGQLQASCGALAGGCGTDVDCGSCPADDTCGGGGIANHCGCPCELPHAITSCAGTPCHIQYCEDGWGDCDGSQATGCEMELLGAPDCPISCQTDDPCPSGYSCVEGGCRPWPVGIIVPWGGKTTPWGWLEADGSAVSRAAWSDLFAVVGTAFGSGNGSTTFNLPDLRARFALGQAQNGTGSTYAQTIGALDHTHSATMAPHTHAVNVPAHSHDIAALPPHAHGWYFTSDVKAPDGTNFVLRMDQTGDTEPVTSGPFSTSTDGAASLTTTAAASMPQVQSANPPYLALRWIVLAKFGAESPCGAVWHYGKDAMPGGAYAADGAAKSRTSQSWLFDCLQTTFGPGDGSTTFGVPDLRGRSALGATTTVAGAALGQAGGSLGHTHSATIQSAAHSLSLPAHTHTANEPAHTHPVKTPSTGRLIVAGSMYGTITGLYPNTEPVAGPTATSSPQPAADVVVPASADGLATSAPADAPFLALRALLFDTASHRLPAGTVAVFVGTEAPHGWLMADGSAVSRSTYAGLFSAIGTTFGSGDGSATFNVPDLRGRAALGKADTGTGAQLGASGGSLDHVHELIVPDHMHTWKPTHTHDFKFSYHYHKLLHYQMIADDLTTLPAGARGVDVQMEGAGSANASTQPGGPAISTAGGGGGTVTVQPANAPYLVLKYIVKQ